MKFLLVNLLYAHSPRGIMSVFDRIGTAQIGCLTKKRSTALQDDEDIKKDRIRLLRLAERLGNISKACRREGVSRTQFYEYKRRLQMCGPEGLKNHPPVHKGHPQATPREVLELILGTSKANPSWGCKRISRHLKRMGRYVSGPTVQKILNRHGRGRLSDRVAECAIRGSHITLWSRPFVGRLLAGHG